MTKTVLQSGLDAQSQTVPGESPEAFAALQAEYIDRYQPTTPDQRFQVDNLIRNEWLLRRYHRVEAQLWTYQTSLCDQAAPARLGEAFAKAGATFMRLHRTIVAAEKAYQSALAELERLQQTQQPQLSESIPLELASFLQTASQPSRDLPRTATPPPHPAAPPAPHTRAERAGAALR